eukprot:CAMPEP_0179084992 /NCGR_PEP_ID=MMETSP0796-20121207/38466_1 /TAXON_ID=73915 /ORGANISM="Pyrodinium bahamense, Strain pbaha01" /LENGTH=505 /DNA_ID=CAMNT_0020782421 /DNA_START=83 /DNA_END=1597 /DNA_ORIENTATION=+
MADSRPWALPPPPADQSWSTTLSPLYVEVEASSRAATPSKAPASSRPATPLRAAATPLRGPATPSRGPLTPRVSSEAVEWPQKEASLSKVASDLKVAEAAQARLMRVIEEVSQELTQRIVGHEAVLTELQRRCAEDAARHDAVSAELARLRGAGGEADSRLARHEAELASLRHLPADTSRQQHQHQQVAAQLQRHEAALLAWKQELQGEAAQREAKLAELQQRLLEQLREQLAAQLTHQLERHEAAVASSQQQLRGEAAQRSAELQEVRQVQQRLQAQLAAQFERHEQAIAAGQQRLHGDLQRRDAELAELQRAAQRFANTAIEKIQGGQDVVAKLTQLEAAIAELHRRDAEQRRRRAAQLEGEAARSAARGQDRAWDASSSSAGSHQHQLSTVDSVFAGAPLYDLRQFSSHARLWEEVAELRQGSSTFGMRMAACERDIGELRREVVGLMGGGPRLVRDAGRSSEPAALPSESGAGHVAVRTLVADPAAAVQPPASGPGPRRTS